MQSKIIDGEVRAGTDTRNNQIRAMVKTGRSQASIAREYGISESAISRIVNRKDSHPEEELKLKSKVLKVLKAICRKVSGK